jgi:peptidoglycan/xylan/chitin deacetylase (PgdA/CDA1 family)
MTPDDIVATVLRYVAPGAIVLMHSGGANRGATVRALPRILSALAEQGYQLVTIPRLIADLDKPAGAGK